MKGHGAKFGRKKEEAIAALLTQKSIEDAAKVIGISPSTLRRWMDDPEFDMQYRRARRRAFGQTTARLQQFSIAAATMLYKTLADPAAPYSSKVRASEIILIHAAKAIELEDIEARVAELERAAEASKSKR